VLGHSTLGPLGSVALRPLRGLGIKRSLFGLLGLADLLGCSAAGSALHPRCLPLGEGRVGGVGAKLLQRRLLGLGRHIPAFGEIRIPEASHVSRPWMDCRRIEKATSARFPSTHTPADHCCFDATARVHTLPGTAPPLTWERNDIGADVILAKELERLVSR